MNIQIQEYIRVRAYHLWEEAGRPENSALHFWLTAEAELLQRLNEEVAAAYESHVNARITLRKRKGNKVPDRFFAFNTENTKPRPARKVKITKLTHEKLASPSQVLVNTSGDLPKLVQIFGTTSVSGEYPYTTAAVTNTAVSNTDPVSGFGTTVTISCDENTNGTDIGWV